MNKESQNTQAEKEKQQFDYSKDKNGWVVFRSQFKKKVKLRAFLRDYAKELLFLDSYENIAECRKTLIKEYNSGGPSAVRKFVNLAYLKEIQITHEEMQDIKNEEEE